ncbi:MAG: hypothetical protein ACM3ZV_00530 [Bacillota bacterium]
MRGAAAFACLLVAACHAQPTAAPQQSSPSPTRDAAPVAEATPVATLEGEWRVAGIDGHALDQPVGIALSASRQEIWWAPRCAGLVRSYTIAGTRFAAGPPLGVQPRRPGEPTPPVCTIAPPPRAGELFQALDSADRIERTPQNGVLISGGGHSLLLFSQ